MIWVDILGLVIDLFFVIFVVLVSLFVCFIGFL